MSFIVPLLLISLTTICTAVEPTGLYASEYEPLERKENTESEAENQREREEKNSPVCFEGEQRVPCKTQAKRGLTESIGPIPSDGIPPAHLGIPPAHELKD